MSMRRLARLLSARWWALSLVAVAGLAAAMAIAGYANSKIEPRFSAETSVVLLTGDEESEAAFDGRLATALTRAREVNAVVLGRNPGSSIAADNDSGELLFVAVSTSATEAQTVAEGLREAYASAAPVSFVDQMEQALEATAAEVELLEEQIAALEPQPPVKDDAATIARRGFLESQIAALEARAAALVLGLAYPELVDGDPEEADRDPQEVTAELAGLETLLIRLNRDLKALPTEETEPANSADRLAKLALERRLRNNEARYLDLAVRLATAKEAGGLSEQVVVISDETPLPISLPLVALVGFLAGGAIAIAVLLLVDRVRRPVWGVEGLEAIPGLGVVPASRPDASSIRPWYPTAAAGPRRVALQGVRAALDGAVPRRPATLAITGLRAPSDQVHALAADLASALVAAGNEVILVDADFQSPSALPEFGVDNVDLATVLAYPDIDAEATRSFIKETLVNLRTTETRLKGLPAGTARLDFSDALAGRHFELLVEEARGLVDMALMVAPGLGHPDADAVCSRLDFVVVVGQTGVTTEMDVEEAVRSLELRGAHPVGLVLIDRPRRGSNRSRSRHVATSRLALSVRRRGRRLTRSRPPVDPMARESQTIDIPIVPLSPRVPLDGETLGQLSGRAKDFLTNRLLSLLDREAGASRRRHGVIPLVEGCGAPTARELLAPPFEAWLSEEGNGATMGYDELFGDPAAGTPQEALQSWLLHGFFADHVAETGHRPVVWHLSSRRGTFQALVHGPNFGRFTIRRIRRRLLGSQRRRLAVQAMSATGNAEGLNRSLRMLAELVDFDAALGQLLIEAEKWPARSTFFGKQSPRPQEAIDDLRTRLAAVQRLGLLPIEVLDEHELEDMTPLGP